MKKRKRRLLRAAVAGLLCFGLLLIFSPLWSPWVLRLVLRANGVDCSRYERIGWTRLALVEVEYTNRSAHASVERIEVPQPVSWLWQRYIAGHPKDIAQPFVVVQDWQLEFLSPKSADGSATAGTQSVVNVAERLNSRLPQLKAWLPSAALTNGLLRVLEEQIECSWALWKDGEVTASIAEVERGQSARLQADLTQRSAITLWVEIDPARVEATLAARLTNAGLALDGDVLWRSNRFNLIARYDAGGLLPSIAELSCEAFQLPSEWFGLRNYSSVTGSLRGDWANGRGVARLEALSGPVQPDSRLPLLMLTLEGDANTNSWQVSTARFHFPGLEGELADPVALDYSGRFLSNEAVMRLESDLGEQPWLPIKGRLRGEVIASSLGTNRQYATFRITGQGLGGFGIESGTFRLSGELTGSQLTLTEAFVELPDGSTAEGSGNFDLLDGMVGDAQLSFNGKYLQQYLPEGWSGEAFAFNLQAQGPWSRLVHNGELGATNLIGPNLPAVSLMATWCGEGRQLDPVSVRIATADMGLELQGSLSAERTSTAIQLNQAKLSRTNRAAFELSQPCRVSIVKTERTNQTNALWKVALDDFDWRSKEVGLRLSGEVEWPHAGRIELGASGLDSDRWTSLLPDWWRKSGTRLQLDRVGLNGNWDHGPLEFNVSGHARLDLTNAPTLAIALDLIGDTNGVAVRELSVAHATNELADVQGRLPLQINPEKDMVSSLVANPGLPLELQLTLAANQPFWDRLTGRTKARLLKPELNASLRGSLQQPLGQVQLDVAAIEFDQLLTSNSAPRLENIRVEIEVSSNAFRLTEGRFQFEDEPVSFSGELALDSRFWESPIKRETWPDWREATGHMRITNAALAAFAAYLPKQLLPQGLVHAELNLRPQAQFNGDITVNGIATKGLLALGAVQDITGQVSFEGRKAEIESLTGVVGGQQLSVTGRVDWTELRNPGWDISLRGNRVPLVRKPGLILRSDLDLRAERKADQTARITGQVNFVDSYFLADLRSLMPGQVASPRRRPPYFSVEAEPYAGYELDVKLRGREFVKVRTPLFQGKLSADLELGGTLREPLAIGALEISSGQVRFPFARVEIEQGQVFLTSENPYRPELYIAGSSQTIGYLVNVEISGPVDDPIWEMSSSPPLSTEAIVLMLTAGEVPREDFSYTQSERAGKLAVFVGRSLLTELWGNEAAADRLTIQTGENVTAEGQETYSVEYKLTDRLSVVGEYDRFGDVNAGVKLKVYSK